MKQIRTKMLDIYRQVITLQRMGADISVAYGGRPKMPVLYRRSTGDRLLTLPRGDMAIYLTGLEYGFNLAQQTGQPTKVTTVVSPSIGRIACHAVPDKDALAKNVAKEPEGERIRQELIDFLVRNKIVGIMLDTDEHVVSIDAVKLPPVTKSVLTLWGSIRVRNDGGAAAPEEGRGLQSPLDPAAMLTPIAEEWFNEWVIDCANCGQHSITLENEPSVCDICSSPQITAERVL